MIAGAKDNRSRSITNAKRTDAKYEAGMTQPGIKTIKSIAKNLNVSIDSLLNYGDNEYVR